MTVGAAETERAWERVELSAGAGTRDYLNTTYSSTDKESREELGTDHVEVDGGGEVGLGESKVEWSGC